MVNCPGCGSDKVRAVGSGDNKTYPHPTTPGVLERFMMILCSKCKWSWNIAGAFQNE